MATGVKKVIGDLLIKRSARAERRVDSGLNSEAALAAAYNVVSYDFQWKRLQTDGNGDQDVNMPDTTTLPLGWSTVIENNGSDDDLVVKSAGTTPDTLKSIIPGRAYKFTLIGNSTANGEWHINFLEESDGISAARYVKIFLNTDWVAGAQIRTITVPESEHVRGIHPMTQTFELDTGEYYDVVVDTKVNQTTGDVVLEIPLNPAALAFTGKIVLI